MEVKGKINLTFLQGPQGVGIETIEKISTQGLIDTYKITYTDSSITTFTISNGTGLEFQWDGTNLGVKKSIDNDYEYIDLRGPQGEIGPRGETGPQGETGEAGYNPVRGIDYWTVNDINEIKSYCDTYIEENISNLLGGSY